MISPTTYVYTAYAPPTDCIRDTDQVSHMYSPKRLDKWFRRWELLDTLITSPGTSMHHLTSYHEKYASRMVEGTPCPPPTGGGLWGTSLHFAEIRADIDSAVRKLPAFEKSVVRLVESGESLSGAARLLKRQKSKVLEAYDTAVQAVASTLGWVDPEAQ